MNADKKVQNETFDDFSHKESFSYGFDLKKLKDMVDDLSKIETKQNEKNYRQIAIKLKKKNLSLEEQIRELEFENKKLKDKNDEYEASTDKILNNLRDMIDLILKTDQEQQSSLQYIVNKSGLVEKVNKS